MNLYETKLTLIRIRGSWPKFEATEGRAKEWHRVFSNVPAADVSLALDSYIKSEKWAPSIAEIGKYLPRHRSNKLNSNASKDQIWENVVKEARKGRAFIRERHPKGYKYYFTSIDRADEIGKWEHLGQTEARFCRKHAEIPEEQLGRGQTWRF